MLVYGDAVRHEDAARVLARLRRCLRELALLPPGLARHARLVAGLIEAGEFAQALADARHVGADAAMSLVRALAECCARSWDSDFEAGAGVPADTLAACADRLPQEPIGLKRPEGYAYYALYPESYLDAARRVHAPSWQVFGVRSIGTSLGAMVAAGLGAGCPGTLRPSGHPFARRLAADASAIDLHAGAFAVVDEGPGLSGSSLAAVGRWLLDAGVAPERLHFFAGHAKGPGAMASADVHAVWRCAQVHAASFEEVILRPERPAHRLENWIVPLVGPLRAPLQDISGGRWRGLQSRPAGEAPPVHPAWERRKFLAETANGRWLVKFIGLGREGERKYLRAKALAAAGFVPRPAGLCHGFVVERWRDDLSPMPAHPAGNLRSRLIDRMGDYLGFRARSFPALERAGASVRALWEMGRFNTEAVLGPALAAAWDAWEPGLDRLSHAVCRIETDNRMHAWEWLTAGTLILKTDAVDHHAAHDLVGCQDLAWDIAGAAVEFELSGDEVARLVARCGRTPDPALLSFSRLCYLAFELARCRETIGAAAIADPPLQAAAARYEEALHAALSASPFATTVHRKTSDSATASAPAPRCTPGADVASMASGVDMEQQQKQAQAQQQPRVVPPVDDDGSSVAGEEDPGAAVEPTTPKAGDEAPPGTPGTGEGICRRCGGSGRLSASEPCPDCGGTGHVTVGIGGA
ncbi:hypothetical protein H4CHR_05979 [Variovorax sp. PBS-H4]|uniref:zinc finger-like domain-containing protein n=1 Tax=Variovorax sp. PBS-H4 TaxID=434008 RepID=UPI0013190B00|nr:zinc finger-like domain-containing protein [Variovorax sp. PBS-H4]VTU41244.1 hypothetical protein H4CHR_05979 [Variovorax sp. PBS-H4]